MADRSSARGKSFKKGVDSDTNRRGRNDTRLQLRKNKREEGLQKRRAMGNATQTPVVANPEQQQQQQQSFNTVEKKAIATSAADIPNLSRMFQKVDATDDDILLAITGFRKMLSIEKNPPVRQVIDSNSLPKFVQLLTHSDPKIQFEAAWTLTNIASTEYTRSVVNSGAVPVLVQMLMSGNPDVREQSAWCLGNIAGDAPDLRDMVLDCGALDSLIMNIANPANDSLLGNVVWALSNFCRGKPQPNIDQISAAIPHLVQLVKDSNKVALMDACWALSYISDGDDERIGAVVNSGVTPYLVQLLASDNASIVTPALRTLGNFVSGDDTHTQAVINANVLFKAEKLMTHPKRNIRKEACWLLSNIAAGNSTQISTLMSNPSLISAVIALVRNAEWEVKKEAAWTICNVATGGNDITTHQLCELGGIDAICSIIDVADPKILMIALEAIDAILKVGKQSGRDYMGFVDECDGLDKIENLQEHENHNVYDKAVYIIEQYFGVEDGEDENLVPTINGDTFSFGIPTANKGEQLETHQQQPLQPFNF
eukprot:CAMPEP_0194083734 /NCGR_PEP_ID=MMETSP0149-20130528/9733_1 /TAXON_ID=122233 /ORGANISM="Chaetoceros debilis, Strain MM31A-1" /LENGTH=540 /DNA_ID=CAMNT_0038766185 /DNA_START=100 /DNA_END=1722 /DNA_ORIENTATION=-